VDEDPETIAVRPDEDIDIVRLEPWLRERLPDAPRPFAIRQFGGGHANLTYLVRFGQLEYVLRRPPLGRVAPTSHDMRREHRVLSRLWEAYPLAPRSFLFCEDRSILGAEFHVMERRHGFVIRQDLPERLLGRPDLNRRIGEMIVDTLADLHTVDPASVGLGELGQPKGYVERQLQGWIERWNAARDRHLDAVDRLIGWLAGDLPRPQTVTLLHNDYKLDNILVDSRDPAVPTAVLDWDMCTRGDPLMDLGYLLNFWTEAGDEPEWIEAASMPTYREGFISRGDVIERYARRTRFDVGRVGWYRVFGIFKLIVIIQQIYIRFLRAQTHDPRFAVFGRRVEQLAEKGLTLAAARSPSE
jgi:aminoglycoside phosphotransferase (APT) family kinase protein